MRILIADDDLVSRRLMEILLKSIGYEVVTAQDGEEALDILSREGAPRLALLDWVMPKLDGLEVCRRIRARQGHPYIHITLLTSKFSEDDIIAGLEAGADDYLTKPCKPKELQARLRTGHRILNLEDTLLKAHEEMRFNATHDALTGLWNHGAILDLLARGLSRMAEMHVPVSVLLCDVDHFKRVNDTYGHLAGDQVLRSLATCLKGALEPGDEVGRYGGEEFLILLHNCSGSQVRERAERIRKAVVSSPCAVDGRDLPVSISIGALAAGDQPAGGPFETLLRKADEALYLAKANGRNRVEYSDWQVVGEHAGQL